MTTQLLTGPAPVQVVDIPTRTELSEVFVPPGFGSRLPSNANGRTPWVVIDRAWARRLGVQRTAGVYRINRHSLVTRLADEETAALLKAGNGSHLVSAA
jgi:hypothetical protein